MFGFGVFQEKMYMPSRAKYILHMLFWAFQGTSRTHRYRKKTGSHKDEMSKHDFSRNGLHSKHQPIR